MSTRTIRVIQRALLVAGTCLLGAATVAFVDSTVSSRRALAAFDQAQAARSAAGRSATASLPADATIDFSLWSEKRVREYKASLSVAKQLPLAVLNIGRLRIRVPVFEGTDDLVLNRGLGWIAGTARPGESGNIGIAGHRDGFFRGLKDIAAGDTMELETLEQRVTYVVDEIEIVTPEQVEVLRPRAAPAITLVTCYPFYFVGDAPQRFIVHATRRQ
jgi:sortase A